jgi:hypothetical protein
LFHAKVAQYGQTRSIFEGGSIAPSGFKTSIALPHFGHLKPNSGFIARRYS